MCLIKVSFISVKRPECAHVFAHKPANCFPLSEPNTDKDKERALVGKTSTCQFCVCLYRGGVGEKGHTILFLFSVDLNGDNSL